MRIHLPLLAVAVAAAAPADAATRNFGITGFERVRVEGPFKVQLTTGVAPFASASGSAAGIDRVAIDMVGRTLVIHSNISAWGGSSNSDSVGPVEVRIGTHELSGATLSGSGSVQINRVKGLSFVAAVEGSGALGIASADVDQLNVSMIGTASSVVAGRTGTLKLTARGVSSFDGSALVAKDATIGAEGASTVKTTVTNSAKIEGSGPATVTLDGKPACTAKLSGSASVSGCRASQ
ncbi:putative autotransporter adhesin-like protein [Sphingomonas sp. F9_3S_D5_B_2]